MQWEMKPSIEPAEGTAAAGGGTAAAGGGAAAASVADGDPTAGSGLAAVSDVAGATQGTLDVTVRFDLPPGAYATMALREVMKLHPAPSRLGHIRFEDP